MNVKSKDTERICLDLILKSKLFPEFKEEIIEGESPDFIIGGTGLEHFLIDVIEDDGSIVRKQKNDIENKINYYSGNEALLEKEISNNEAINFVERIINSQLKGIGRFSYSEFIENFKRVYQKHFSKIREYKKKCGKIGFLIEIRYINPGKNGYVIEDKKGKRHQCLRTIPITYDMIDCFNQKDNVDFIILCIFPISGINKNKEIQVIKVDMTDVENSIRQQGMIICNSFDFSRKFTNNEPVKLNIASKEELENENNRN